ncbi:MAG: Ribonuclease VapC [Acidobacteria bacterium]|nr:Ribonuclease VapC [Acidobacteriota bacterium]
MIAYLDSSVILRIALQESEPLREWADITYAVTSWLAVVECRRALMRIGERKDAEETVVNAARAEVEAMLGRCLLWDVSAAVIDIAAQPFPKYVAALDSVHLATAIVCREEQAFEQVSFATHDRQLATAARAMNFPVLGA